MYKHKKNNKLCGLVTFIVDHEGHSLSDLSDFDMESCFYPTFGEVTQNKHEN